MKLILPAMWASSLLLAAMATSASAQGPGEPEIQDEAFAKLFDAEKHYYELKALAQAAYRKDLAKAFGIADRIEVYLLDGAWSKTDSDLTRLPAGEFPIIPYRAKTTIQKTVTLTPEQRAEFLPALQKVLNDAEPSGILGHFLTHGIRVFSGERILFQTSISWDCRNFYVDYPDDSGFEGFVDIEEFKKAFGKVMPIPEKKENGAQPNGE